jgi:hypothetical protein
MRSFFSLMRIMIPIFNANAKEQKGSAAVVLAFIAALMAVAVAGYDVVEEVKPAVETPAPDVQDQDTDASDILDVTDPPDAGGDLVVLSTVRVSWDDSYDAPRIHRRGAKLGGWSEYVARQRDCRRRGVR